MQILGVVFPLCLLLIAHQFVTVTLADRENCGPNDDAPALRVNTTERLAAFRVAMVDILIQSQRLSAFIVGSGDAHNSEYPSDYDKRRGFISGFSGSAGTAVITATKAALWTDGRYFLEAEEALDCNWILMKEGLADTPSIEKWLNTEITTPGALVGVDQSLITNSYFLEMEKKFLELSQRLVLREVQSSQNPVDAAWSDNRPSQPVTAINPLPVSFAGKSWDVKISELRSTMKDEGAIAFVVTSLDEIAWLFNLRANDIAYNPFLLSYAIVEMDKLHLFILNKDDRLKSYPTEMSSVNQTLAEHLNASSDGTCSGTDMCVQVHDYLQDDVETAVRNLAAGGNVWISHVANYGIYLAVANNRLVKNSPIALDKSMKNPTERAKMQECYNRDSVVLIKFLAYMEKQIQDGKRWTEVSAAAELDNRRKQAENNRGLSFETISSYGSNGAIIHYRPSTASNKVISTDSLYLLDSGGQYLDGTTDVTRTMHYGEPTAYQKECYSRVLASVINLAQLRWPENLYGRQIDAIARYALWDAGLIYHHGTGHGIGAYLSVHEGPGRISLSSDPPVYQEPLYAYQYYSDEPGYYESGKFGIRLETIMMIRPHKPKYSTASEKFYEFTPITLVPFEPNLIDFTFLTTKQIEWLNDYNAMIRKVILPMLTSDSEATAWVNSRTEPINAESPGAASFKQPNMILMLTTILLAICMVFT